MNALRNLLASSSKRLLRQSLANVDCECAASRSRYLGQSLGCLAEQLQVAPQQACSIWTRIRAGQLTIGEYGKLAQLGIAGYFIFTIGEVIGRGGVIGITGYDV